MNSTNANPIQKSLDELSKIEARAKRKEAKKQGKKPEKVVNPSINNNVDSSPNVKQSQKPISPPLNNSIEASPNVKQSQKPSTNNTSPNVKQIQKPINTLETTPNINNNPKNFPNNVNIVTNQELGSEVNKAEARAKRKVEKKQNKGAKNSEKLVDLSTPNTTENSPNTITNQELSTEVNKAEARTKRKEETKQDKKPINSSTFETSPNLKNPTESPPNTQQQPELSKSELRAQRRAKQEAQRLAKTLTQKLSTTESKSIPTNQQKQSPSDKPKVVLDDEKRKQLHYYAKNRSPLSKIRKDSISVVSAENFQKQVQLFNHLYLKHSTSLSKESKSAGLHAAIIKLGTQYLAQNIIGSNARCLALLSAIKRLVIDYRTPPHEEFCRSFETNLQTSINYLQKCRPLAVSMTNAVRNIKRQFTQMPADLSDEEKKARLLDAINTYVNEEIGMADKAISITVRTKIYKGDVILTYGFSSIIMKILLDAHKEGKLFSVVVVDSRPLLEGRELLRKLVNAGINCSYILINAASFIMGKVTKVLLGAHSLLANGYVMARAGTAQVALVAQSFNKPVLVCCETYKFCERVQTDSIVHNEIGDPNKLVTMLSSGEKSPLAKWKDIKYVTPLNLMYDVTPPDLVTAVVTETSILPCTSVPVILRIKPNELTM